MRASQITAKLAVKAYRYGGKNSSSFHARYSNSQTSPGPTTASTTSNEYLFFSTSYSKGMKRAYSSNRASGGRNHCQPPTAKAM